MTLRFNNGGFTIVEKLFKALREILQHWRLSLASLLFYILLSLLTNVCRENLLVLASTSKTSSPRPSYHTLTEQSCPEASQCHTLGNLSHAESICNLSVRCRTQASLEFNLGVCSWRSRSNLVQLGNSSSDCLSMPNRTDCVECLQGFVDSAREVEENFEDYSSILRRYDCDRNYSMWGCEQCKAVYKNWLCGITFDYYAEGELIKPCLAFCYQTSRKCPFLLPAIQYCGTQAYFCPQYRDLLHNSSYAHKNRCYKCTNTNGTQCTPELTNSTDPLSSGSAGSTTASVTSLLIAQLVLLLITVTLFDLPVGLA